MTPLFLIVFLDLVGFGMIIPILPFYAERLGVSSSLVIFIFGLYSLGQLFGSPIWGAVSDRTGRRPILLVTLGANVLANILLAHAVNGWELAASRLVSGLAAGNISIAYAYLTDVTDDASRPRALGMLGAAFGLGFILGPAIGGLLAGGSAVGTNIALVAYTAAALSALALIATWFFLPESHGAEHRAMAKTRPRGEQWALLQRPALRSLLISAMMVTGAVAMLQSTYAMWSAEVMQMVPRTLGWFYAFVGVISVSVQAGGIGTLNRRFGALGLARSGGMLVGVALLIMPFSPSALWTLIPLALFGVGGAFFTPSISVLVTNTASASERGSVMGVFQASSSLGRVLGPMLASAIAAFAGLQPPFFVGAAITLAGSLLIRHHVGSGAPPRTGETASNADLLRAAEEAAPVGEMY